MNNKFMDGLLNLAGKMASNSVLSAIKDAFIDNMPIVIVGAFCTLFTWVISTVGGVSDGAGGIIKYISLANIGAVTTDGGATWSGGLSFLSKLAPIWNAANYGCMNFMAVAICILVSIHFAENKGVEHDNVVPANALACFITLVTTTQTFTQSGADVLAANPDLPAAVGDAESISFKASGVVTSGYTSANGLFVGLLVGILCTLLYIKLAQSGKLTIHLPDSVPPNVSASFAALFPSAITILVTSLVGYLVSLTGHDVFGVIATIMSPLKAIITSLPGYLVVVFLMQLLWWFGIHGPNTMSAVYTAFFQQTMAENLTLYQHGLGVGRAGVFYSKDISYGHVTEAMADQFGLTKDFSEANGMLGYRIITNPFQSGFFSSTGSGITMGLIIAIFLFSKRDDYKAIARLAIAPGLFNINEPIIFGIPMVMNPLLGVPFFLAPLLTTSIGYLVTRIGWCPLMIIDVPWTTPVGIFGLLSSSNWLGAVWQIVIIIGVSTLVYTPFVIASNAQKPEEAAA